MSDGSLRQQIGRLLFVGIPGPTFDDHTRSTLEALYVGGVVLFRRNVETPAQLAQLIAALHALPSRPLVAIDHEGGRVNRLGEPFTQFPAAAAVGRRRDAELAYRVGRAMAAELRSIGIDVNFAPVLDVNSNPANPVIGDRAFSSEADVVGELGIAQMRGLLDGGVVPCGKHFPGHGDTVKDSHLELPVVDRPRVELERTELVPFRAAIAAGVPMLMTAHVLYPSLDPEHPATVSRRILTGLLREEMRFQGVVVSDDLQMRAISEGWDIGGVALATLEAGVDALLVCQDLSQAVAARAAIERGVDSGTLAARTVAAAAVRVGRLCTLRPPGSPAACELPNAAHHALVADILRAD